MTATERINLVLRTLMEFGVVLGFGYWGYHVGARRASKVALAIGTPLVGFGIWGAIDFHQFGRRGEGLRLLEELFLSGLAAVALWMAGQAWLGAALAVLSVVYHVLVYATGHRLLKHAPAQRDGSGASTAA
jgi:hypothetical protein